MDVGEMQQGDLAERVEAQQVGLGDLLAGGGGAQPRHAAHDDGGGGGCLQNVAAAQHDRFTIKKMYKLKTRPPQMRGGRSGGLAADAGCFGRKSVAAPGDKEFKSEEHTSELQSLMRNSYDVFCL